MLKSSHETNALKPRAETNYVRPFQVHLWLLKNGSYITFFLICQTFTVKELLYALFYTLLCCVV